MKLKGIPDFESWGTSFAWTPLPKDFRWSLSVTIGYQPNMSAISIALNRGIHVQGNVGNPEI